MDSVLYYTGVVLAISSGLCNAIGTIFQKKGVNRTCATCPKGQFARLIWKDPFYVTGFLISMILATICGMSAQGLIGPSLTPGFQASGLVVMAIGSVKFNKEKLRPIEIAGIILLICGVTFLGFSQLAIPKEDVHLTDYSLDVRITIYTLILLGFWFFLLSLARKDINFTQKGILFAVSGGFIYALSQFWISPLMSTIGLVFGGKAVVIEIVIFVIACFVLVGTNIIGIRQNQEMMRFAQASKGFPLQNIPMQIAPIFVYFVVFMKTATTFSTIMMVIGVAFIIISVFFLGQRSQINLKQNLENLQEK